jgi:TolB-like protein/Tfp pilus assembly protein PilF
MIKIFFSELKRRGAISVLLPYTLTVWLVIQVASIVLPALAAPEWVLTLIIIVSAIGFPIVFYIAWFFDYTETGFKLTPTRHKTDVIEPLSLRHWLGLSLISVAAIASGLIIFDNLKTKQDLNAGIMPAPQDETIAVMVFRDLSPEQELAYLTEGLAEELIVTLGQTSKLTVTALSSSRQFAGTNEAPAKIGEMLGVASILEGSVRLTGDQITVTATLLDSATGKTRWTQKYARSLSKIAALENEVAQAIYNQLTDSLLESGDKMSGHAASADAYLMYLRGRQSMRERSKEAIQEARKYFEQAINLDSEYAPAYVGLADSIRFLTAGVMSFGDIEPQIAIPLAKRNIDKAMLRSPNMATAFAALGQIEWLAGNNDAALAAYDKAISLNHSYADVHLWRYLLLIKIGRTEDALDSLATAQKLDPLSPAIMLDVGAEKVRQGKMQEALTVYEQLITLQPESPLGYRGAAGAAYLQGDLVASAKFWHLALQRSPESTQLKDSLGSLFLELHLPQAAVSLLPEDEYAVNFAIAAEDYAKALSIIHTDQQGDPNEPLLAYEAAWYELLWGDKERAKTLLRGIQDSIKTTGYYDEKTCAPNIIMAYAYEVPEQREPWLDICRQYVRSRTQAKHVNAELSYLQARLFALDGDLDKAATLLIEAIDGGWRSEWTPFDPLLSALLPRQDVQEKLAWLQQDLVQQRQQVLELAKRWGYVRD